MRATCNHCSYDNVQDTRQAPAPAWREFCQLAIQHEKNNPDHRVTVWDTPTSQYPREYWND